jgi:hypothetical protein
MIWGESVDDTELEEEEENLVERSHREILDAKERLRTAVHIKQIRKYKDGLISHDELSPTPVSKRKTWRDYEAISLS